MYDNVDTISRTLTSDSQNCGNRQLVKLNNKAQAQTIYDSDGIATTLSANGGGQGGKTGLYRLNNNKQGQRIYDCDGLSVSLNATANNDYYKVPIKCVGNIYKSSQLGNVYDTDGLIGTLCAGDYDSPKKIIVNDERKIKVEGNFASNSRHNGNVYNIDGVSPTLCCSDYKRGKWIKIDKCYGSTQKHRAETDGDYSPTLTASMGNGGGHVPMCKFKDIKIKNATKKGYIKAEEEEDGINIERASCDTRRGRVQKKKTGTLNTGDGSGWAVHKNYRICKLMPIECERLQGFPDNWTALGKDDEKISDTQRYKCCGNAVTTNVITFIMNNWVMEA